MFLCMWWLFFFNDTATTEIYTLSLHDALPIWKLLKVETEFVSGSGGRVSEAHLVMGAPVDVILDLGEEIGANLIRSEEHTSELQSRQYLVCRLLLEKKKLK